MKGQTTTKIALGMLSLIVTPCFASEILNFTGGSFVPSVHNQTIGWGFVVNSPLTVSDLSWYDPTGSNPVNRLVGIWDSNGNLIGSACVGSTCGSTYQGSFWVSPASVVLSVGTYVIGGYVLANGADPFVLGAPTITTDPKITYLGSLFTVSNSLVEPTHSCCGQGFFGPDFSVSGVVPEPSSLILAGLSLGMAGSWRLLGLKRLGAASSRCKRTNVENSV